VAVAAIKCEKTLLELAQAFDVHPNQIKQWRDQLLEGATGVFGEAAKGVGETDARSATTEPTLAAKVPTFGVNYAYVKMTEELANDGVIDITDWFEREVDMAMGEAEMASIISGKGTNKRKGMLNVAPEAGADGSRTSDAFRFLPAASATAFTSDELLTMVCDLKARYRANGRWLMNSATAGMLRKLKSGDGMYLWQETVVNGQPSTFSGYPVTIVEAMPDVAAAQHPIAFGDFEAAYIMAQIQGMTVTAQDQSITEPGFNKLYVRQRIGGCVYDENAVRFLKMAAV
jgi:HK97 family phage major capsid protein